MENSITFVVCMRWFQNPGNELLLKGSEPSRESGLPPTPSRITYLILKKKVNCALEIFLKRIARLLLRIDRGVTDNVGRYFTLVYKVVRLAHP
jgi:hypothetical protein